MRIRRSVGPDEKQLDELIDHLDSLETEGDPESGYMFENVIEFVNRRFVKYETNVTLDELLKDLSGAKWYTVGEGLATAIRIDQIVSITQEARK